MDSRALLGPHRRAPRARLRRLSGTGEHSVPHHRHGHHLRRAGVLVGVAAGRRAESGKLGTSAMSVELAKAPSFRLDGKRALVTGAGRGIGLAAASALADAGAHVTLAARTREEIE